MLLRVQAVGGNGGRGLQVLGGQPRRSMGDSLNLSSGLLKQARGGGLDLELER